VLFTAGIALTGLLFGLAPAWYAFRAQPAMALGQAGRGPVLALVRKEPGGGASTEPNKSGRFVMARPIRMPPALAPKPDKCAADVYFGQSSIVRRR
jgi:hypothetical protein